MSLSSHKSNLFIFARSLLLSLILVGAVGAAARAEPTLLNWEDLLPEGEMESLIEQYDRYVEELERQLMQNRRSLSSADSAYSDLDPVIEEGSSFDVMPQLGTFKAVDDLDGKDIRIPGYIVPFDFSDEGKYSEFLLVPYFGACVHVPPPPPNQIIYVTTDKPVEIQDTWQAFYAEGILNTEKHMNSLGSAAYTLRLRTLEVYTE